MQNQILVSTLMRKKSRKVVTILVKILVNSGRREGQ